MSENKLYTVSIYTENNIGLLNRISAIFQRRHINIESINSSISETEEIKTWKGETDINPPQEKSAAKMGTCLIVISDST